MKKIVIASSIIIFIVMVVFISSFSMEDDALSHAGGHIPDDIGAFTLINKIEGEEANRIVNQLHGREVELDVAYAIEYQTRGGSFALVWISESNQEGKPTKLFEEMKQIMAVNNAYSNNSEKLINDKVVQYALGVERDTYYFVSNNRFIFVETFEDTRDRFIKNAVKIF
ncbi:hypothetical protein RJD24_19020 [Bacillaceae bacterium IKA-2]|nr:hypothetical protein RJD24_19020 [Bacillaceae bacterium IKA-2]